MNRSFAVAVIGLVTLGVAAVPSAEAALVELSFTADIPVFVIGVGTGNTPQDLSLLGLAPPTPDAPIRVSMRVLYDSEGSQGRFGDALKAATVAIGNTIVEGVAGAGGCCSPGLTVANNPAFTEIIMNGVYQGPIVAGPFAGAFATGFFGLDFDAGPMLLGDTLCGPGPGLPPCDIPAPFPVTGWREAPVSFQLFVGDPHINFSALVSESPPRGVPFIDLTTLESHNVPQPSTLMLFALGLGLLAVVPFPRRHDAKRGVFLPDVAAQWQEKDGTERGPRRWAKNGLDETADAGA